LNNLQVTLLPDVEDSRCPSDVQCIWAGYEKVNLVVNTINWPQNISFTSVPKLDDSPAELTIAQFRIKLINVVPYPTANIKIDPSQQKAILLIEKISP